MIARSCSLALSLAFLGSSQAALGQTSGLFDAPEYVTGSSHGEFRARGDFNQDGHQDLLHMTNWLAWNGMTVFLGDGLGNFAPQAELSWSIPTGYEYAEFEPIVGDFDDDGNLDVAVERNSSSLTDGLVIFSGDGAGGFSGQTVVPMGAFVGQLYAGEIDGDPGAEILVKFANAGTTRFVTWLNWNGSTYGQSTPLQVSGMAFPDGLFVEGLGDIDGDGDDDIIGTSTAPFTKVRVFPTVNGASTYGAQFPIPAHMQVISHRIKSADLDGDGDQDAIFVCRPTPAQDTWVQPYENVGGVLVQRPAQLVPTPTSGTFPSQNLILEDWDGDGWLDLISHSVVLHIVQSNGDWSYTDALKLTGINQSKGAGAFDANGDGRMDYVGGRTIQFGAGDFVAQDPTSQGASIPYPDGFVVQDFEGDGDLDLLGGNGGNWYINNGAGGLIHYIGSQGLFGGIFPDAPPGNIYDDAVAFGDFTGNGSPDYLLQMIQSSFPQSSPAGIRLLASDGHGEFVDQGEAIPGGVWISPIGLSPDSYWESADVDSDGDLDLLVMDGYWRNDGTGIMDGFVPAWTGRAFDATDANGDGNMDVLVRTLNAGQSELELYLQISPGTFAVRKLGTIQGTALARFVDVDHDGDMDVAAADPDGRELLLIEYTGSGFATAVTLDAHVPNLRMLGLEDINGDGATDLIAIRKITAGVSSPKYVVAEYLRTAPGFNFTLGKQYYPDPLKAGFEGLVDMDGDGDLDLTGKFIHWSNLVPPGVGGVTQQFGEGSPGTGGLRPILGGFGPVSSTNPGSALRIVEAVGGGFVYLVYSQNEIAVANVPFAGMTLYVGAPVIVGPFPLGGAPGIAGAGSLVIPLPKSPALAGLTYIQQAFVLDPASPTGVAASNGLRLTYGN